MKHPQVSVAGMMAVVPLAAAGFVALRSPSDLWAMLLISITLSVLAWTTLLAILRSGPDRAGWVGFSLFGWIYLYFAIVARYQGIPLVTQWVVDHFNQGHSTPTLHVQTIVHSLGTLAAGAAGYYAAFVIAAREAALADPARSPEHDHNQDPRPPAGGPRP